MHHFTGNMPKTNAPYSFGDQWFALSTPILPQGRERHFIEISSDDWGRNNNIKIL